MMNDSNNVNLNLLKFFIVTAESKSIAEAGKKMGYSTSNVSENIAMLEQQLDLKLFTRKPLKLTEIGQDIYDNIKNGFTHIDFALLIANSKNNIECGKISIGCPSHITNFYLMERIAKAVKDYPNLQINLDTAHECEQLIEDLKNNKIDFAIIDRIPQEYSKEVEIEEIKRSENIFIANKKIVIKNIKELMKYKYILTGEQRTTMLKLLEVLQPYNVKLEAVLRCRSYRAKNKWSKTWNRGCLCFKRGNRKRIEKQ